MADARMVVGGAKLMICRMTWQTWTRRTAEGPRQVNGTQGAGGQQFSKERPNQMGPRYERCKDENGPNEVHGENYTEERRRGEVKYGVGVALMGGAPRSLSGYSRGREVGKWQGAPTCFGKGFRRLMGKEEGVETTPKDE